jgi:hypothetical protein
MKNRRVKLHKSKKLLSSIIPSVSYWIEQTKNEENIYIELDTKCRWVFISSNITKGIFLLSVVVHNPLLVITHLFKYVLFRFFLLFIQYSFVVCSSLSWMSRFNAYSYSSFIYWTSFTPFIDDTSMKRKQKFYSHYFSFY